MKKIKLLLLSALACFTLAACGEATSTEETNTDECEHLNNLLDNGDFSQKKAKIVQDTFTSIGSYSLFKLENGVGDFNINDENQLEVKIDNFGDKSYSIQLNYSGLHIEKGSEYHLCFDVKSKNPQNISCVIQQNYGTYLTYWDDSYESSTSMSHVYFNFTADKDDENVALVLNMGKFDEYNYANNVVILDNIYFSQTNAAKPVNKGEILVNQVGFKPDSSKHAIVRGEIAADKYDIVDTKNNYVIYSGTLGETKYNKSSLENCTEIDFSAFKRTGTFKIVIDGIESSTFSIDYNPYVSVFKSSIDMLYSQRCGQLVQIEDYAHGSCHLSDALVYGTNERIDVIGGWHDAGDYGKYVVPGAKTVADLLLTYELYYDAYKDNNIRDVLEEAMFELDWMLKMQTSDGGVYHKVTTYGFPGMDVDPEYDTADLVVSPVSYAATADFAASMAYASRVLLKAYPEKANIYLEAAKKAFNALANIEAVSFTNPSAISTGEYPDNELLDEYLWAAIELYRATDEIGYKNSFEARLDEAKNYSVAFGWENMLGYALYSYLKVTKMNDVNYSQAIKKLVSLADKYVKNLTNDAYQSPIGELYSWGSNMVVTTSATLFKLLDDLGNSNYNEYIQSQIDYLLGKNTTGYCFITGFGTKSPVNPHHRPSVVNRKAVVGMLIGGPNNDFANNGGDTTATSYLQGKASPAGSYIDNVGSWSTNEVTIYWNSSFTLAIAALL